MTLLALHSPHYGAGKTTVAKMLEAILPDVVRISFADPVREMARALLASTGLEANEIERLLTRDKNDPIPSVGGLDARSLMIRIGNEFGRDLSPGFWVGCAASKIDLALHRGKTVVIDDLRFEEEYQFLTERKSQIWSIVRENAKHDKAQLHIIPDRIVHNNGSHRALAQEILQATLSLKNQIS